MWDYDIKSCHFTITVQLAERHGYDAKEIKNYIKDKDATHRRLQDEYGIYAEDAKQGFLTLLYGGPLSAQGAQYGRKESALYENMGDLAKDFINDDQVKAICADIRGCKDAILTAEGYNHIHNREIVNMVGLPFVEDATEPQFNPRNQMFCHIVTGYEAHALELVVEHRQGEIMLLSHDGFVVDEPIDCAPIAEAFYNSTGIHIEFKATELGRKKAA